MKLRTRLIVSFCIIIVLPLTLACGVLFGVYKLQTKAIQQTYGIEATDSLYGVLSNSIQLMNRYTKSDFEEIQNLSKTDPGKLESDAYLKSANERLREKSSFLIFRKNGQLVFNGYEGESSVTREQWEEKLPASGDADVDSAVGYYLEGAAQSLLKQVDFRCADGAEGDSLLIPAAIDFPVMKLLSIDLRSTPRPSSSPEDA